MWTEQKAVAAAYIPVASNLMISTQSSGFESSRAIPISEPAVLKLWSEESLTYAESVYLKCRSLGPSPDLLSNSLMYQRREDAIRGHECQETK